MANGDLAARASDYLRKLSVEIPTRTVGSAGNRAATDFFAETMAGLGWEIERQDFECIDWREAGAVLSASGAEFDVLVSPYSLGGSIAARLAVVSTADMLESTDVESCVLLLHGEIAAEQLMPKNFPFYNPDEHRRIVGLLEAKCPAAIISATTRNPEMAGAVYPFPLIEDGDFDIPSAYMTAEEGERLASHAGETVALELRAERSASVGCNVVARKGRGPKRLVVFAHIDAKRGTPGAIDNASGVSILLLLAGLLAEYVGNTIIELVALNGEDHYSAAGEKRYLAAGETPFADAVLGVNIDGAGYRDGGTAYSLYNCSPELEDPIRAELAGRPGIVEGEPWYQGDHGLFLMHDVPALAVTSEHFVKIWSEIAHTERDTLDVLNVARLVETALALRDVVDRIDRVATRRPRIYNG
jgi:aminopeptidase YwaD